MTVRPCTASRRTGRSRTSAHARWVGIRGHRATAAGDGCPTHDPPSWPAVTRPAAVVFDNDGLMLDTEQAWTRAEELLFAPIRPRVHDRPQARPPGLLARGRARPSWSAPGAPGRGAGAVDELFALVMVELDHGAPPLPGAVELIGALRGRGVRSGSPRTPPRAFVDAALRVAGCSRRPVRRRSWPPTRSRTQAGARRLPRGRRRARRRPGGRVALEDSPTASPRPGRRHVGHRRPLVPGVVLDEARPRGRVAARPARGRRARAARGCPTPGSYAGGRAARRWHRGFFDAVGQFFSEPRAVHWCRCCSALLLRRLPDAALARVLQHPARRLPGRALPVAAHLGRLLRRLRLQQRRPRARRRRHQAVPDEARRSRTRATRRSPRRSSWSRSSTRRWASSS